MSGYGQGFIAGLMVAALFIAVGSETPLAKRQAEKKYWSRAIPEEYTLVKGEDNLTAEVKIGMKDNQIIFVRKEIKKTLIQKTK